jgi:hypothetical protein
VNLEKTGVFHFFLIWTHLINQNYFCVLFFAYFWAIRLEEYQKEKKIPKNKQILGYLWQPSPKIWKISQKIPIFMTYW